MSTFFTPLSYLIGSRMRRVLTPPDSKVGTPDRLRLRSRHFGYVESGPVESSILVFKSLTHNCTYGFLETQ